MGSVGVTSLLVQGPVQGLVRPRGIAGHQQADLLGVEIVVAVNADELALVHHGDAVGQGEDLRELGRDEDDRLALLFLVKNRAVDVLDGAQIEAAGRLVKDDHLAAAVDLAGQDDLLLVAAREAAGDCLGARGLDIVGPDLFGGKGVELFAVDQGVLDPRGVKARLEEHVLGQLHRHDQPVAVAVGGNIADPQCNPLTHRLGGNIGAVKQDLARGQAAIAADGVAERILPVAADAGDAEDLAAVHLEADVLDAIDALAGVADADVLQLQPHRAGSGGYVFDIGAVVNRRGRP